MVQRDTEVGDRSEFVVAEIEESQLRKRGESFGRNLPNSVGLIPVMILQLPRSVHALFTSSFMY